MKSKCLACIIFVQLCPRNMHVRECIDIISSTFSYTILDYWCIAKGCTSRGNFEPNLFSPLSLSPTPSLSIFLCGVFSFPLASQANIYSILFNLVAICWQTSWRCLMLKGLLKVFSPKRIINFIFVSRFLSDIVVLKSNFTRTLCNYVHFRKNIEGDEEKLTALFWWGKNY